MTSDVINRDNYIEFNITLAHKIGRDESVYLGELIRISSKATRKNKLTDNHFTLDREYMWMRTVAREAEQKKIEKSLEDKGLISFHASLPDTLRVNLDVYKSLMCMDDIPCADSSAFNNYSKQRSSKNPSAPRKTNKQKQLEEVIAAVPDCETDLKDAVVMWVKYASAERLLTDLAVINTFRAVFNASNGNKAVMIETFRNAAEKRWRTKEWIVDWCKKNYPQNNTPRHDIEPVEVCTALSGDPF